VCVCVVCACVCVCVCMSVEEINGVESICDVTHAYV